MAIKVSVAGFVRASLIARIKRTKAAIIAKTKLLAALEAELKKYSKK